MRSKTKEGKIASFNLSTEEIELMEAAVSMGPYKSNSEYIGWLIRSNERRENPAKQLKQLEEEELKIREKIDEIKEKRNEIIKHIDLCKQMEIARNKKRPEAVKILQRKIIEDGILEAEQIARNWSKRIDVPASELLAEAMIKVRDANDR
jgi:Arc/MetJ-type ribon-helix-helix transcriptional regulator